MGKMVRNIALICSVVGLALIYFASGMIEIEPVRIGEIGIDDIGTGVMVCGIMVKNSSVTDSRVSLDIWDRTGKIKVVIFDRDVPDISAEDEICATGRVDEYPKGSGRLEIISKAGSISLYD